ncbi:MAG: hypothetical protein RL138_936 [Bacteroidota bacterium]
MIKNTILSSYFSNFELSMKKVFYTLFFLSLIHFASAQNLMWAKKMGALRPNDVAYAIASDQAGNSISVGTFRDTADLDPSATVQLFYSAGQEDVFITKLDSNGQYLWSHQLGGLQGDFGYAVTTDKNNNVYVGGSFSNRCDFNIGGTSLLINSTGSYDAFVLKLSATGTLLWVKTFGGTSAEEVFALTAKANGHIAIGGYFMGTCDFDPSAANFNLTAQGTQDAFINELDSNGNFVQALAISGSLKDCVYGLCSDANNNCYASGYFEGSADFDPSNNTYNLQSAGGVFDKDFFIAKYASNGNLVWAKSGGGLMADIAFGICLDSKNNVLTTGWFESQADFDPSNNVYSVSAYAGTNDRDAFVLKLDSNGLFKWVAPLGGTDIQTGYGIACDQSDNIYTAGFNKDSMDIDPSTNQQMITSKGDFDLYVHSLDANGNYNWGFDIGGITDDGANALCVDLRGNVLVAGGTSDTADFDPATQDTFQLQTQYLYDVFIAKFGACHQAYIHGVNYSETLCEGQAAIIQLNGTKGSAANWLIAGPMPFGSQAWYYSSNSITFPVPQSGSYMLMPSSSCFGLVSDTLVFNIHTVNANFSIQGNNLLAADTTLLHYQWMECFTTNMQVINGANNYSFTPTHTGSYALVAQDSLCSDTSSCILFSFVGMNEVKNSAISISQNENQGIVLQSKEEFHYSVYNSLGELIARGENRNQLTTIESKEWPTGIYLVNVETAHQRITRRIMIAR